MDTTNAYLAAAEARWKSGEDGEEIARELAHALKYMIQEGIGRDKSITDEFLRLAD